MPCFLAAAITSATEAVGMERMNADRLADDFLYALGMTRIASRPKRLVHEEAAGRDLRVRPVQALLVLRVEVPQLDGRIAHASGHVVEAEVVGAVAVLEGDADAVPVALLVVAFAALHGGHDLLHLLVGHFRSP